LSSSITLSDLLTGNTVQVIFDVVAVAEATDKVYDVVAAMNLWILLVCTALVEIYVLRRLGFDWLLVALVLGSTLLCVDYLFYTSISERNYDGPSQIRYIRAIADHLRLPDVYDCGPCGHPPLYYALAALWSKVVLMGGWMPLELGLQWLSLLLFFGFVTFALVILQSCTTNRRTAWLAAALIAFWPSSIINSVRVHNDALASFLILGAMYFIAQWDRGERSRDFYAALAASCLSLLTKASGYTVVAVLILFTVLRLRSSKLSRRSLQQCATAIVVLAGVGALAVGLRESRNPTTLCQKILGHACDGRYVPVIPDSPSRFVDFDVQAFVRHIDPVPADAFPTRLAKSSLFGVVPLGKDFGGEYHQNLAMVISALLLVMVTFCLVSLGFPRFDGQLPYAA